MNLRGIKRKGVRNWKEEMEEGKWCNSILGGNVIWKGHIVSYLADRLSLPECYSLRCSLCSALVYWPLHMTSLNHNTLIGSQSIKVLKSFPVGIATSFFIMAFSSALRFLLREYVGTRKLQKEPGCVLFPSCYSPQAFPPPPALGSTGTYGIISTIYFPTIPKYLWRLGISILAGTQGRSLC